MNRLIFCFILMCLWPVSFSCAEDGATGSDGDADGDGDTDSDGDADSDGDGDGDADSDGDSDDEIDIDDGADLSKVGLIDDLEDRDTMIREVGGRVGMWYVFNDETDGGEQTPGDDFYPSECGPDASLFCAKTSGSGFTDWGAGMGFDLLNPGDAKCEGYPPEGRHPYDASKFDGIAFKAKGAGHKVIVDVTTMALLPEEEGGECTDGDNCFDVHGRTLTLQSEWTQYAYMFDKLKQDGWGKEVAFDPKKIVNVLFMVDKNVDFDFSIDDVVFFGNEDDDEYISEGTEIGIDDLDLTAGFRASTYGEVDFEDREYWASVGTRMADQFSGATPSAIWIVGEVATDAEDPDDNGTCKLNFPGVESQFDWIEFNECDLNEKALRLFDEQDYKLWLQVEPGFADLDELIDLVLQRYSQHPCVIGFAIDVEFHQTGQNGGNGSEPVTDAQAESWLAHVREYNPNYSLILKDWRAEMMPSAQEGLIFLSDAQGTGDLDGMAGTFGQWASAFSGSITGYQVGYESDEDWWADLGDPVGDIGDRLLGDIDSMKVFFWVDFTIKTVFPP